jgi:uncharacterized GH25 family protein
MHAAVVSVLPQAVTAHCRTCIAIMSNVSAKDSAKYRAIYTVVYKQRLAADIAAFSTAAMKEHIILNMLQYSIVVW